MSQITAYSIKISDSVNMWRVIISEPRIAENKHWRKYRGTRTTGEARESLERVLERVIATHRANMIACGRSMSEVSHMIFFDHEWRVIPHLSLRRGLNGQ